MKLQDLDQRQLQDQLRQGRLGLRMTPFAVRMRSDLPHLAGQIAQLYRDFELLPEDDFADFHVAVMRSGGLLGRWRDLAEFWFDGQRSFSPLPAAQGLSMLEWGINWCVAAHAHQYLLIHAAVLERDGRALVMPAPPGSGKSTLCAALAQRGWRLLSDELGLLDLGSGLLHGMARPINLKNQSIPVMQAFAPQGVFSPSMPNTAKGTVALLRAPDEAIARRLEPARPAWVVLPRWEAGAPAELEPVERAQAFMAVADQSFNYDLHGQAGFLALGRMIQASSTWQFRYSDLDHALPCFDRLCPPNRLEQPDLPEQPDGAAP